MEAKWICGDGRLSSFFGDHRGIASDYCPIIWFWIFRPPGIGRQERLDSGRRRLPRVFPNFLDDMTLYFGIFPVFRGIFPNTYGMF